MKQLNSLAPVPPDSHYSAFCKIRDKKHLTIRQRLKNKNPYLSGRYQALDAAIVANNLNSLTTSRCSAQLRNALLSCYSVSSKGLKALKKAIDKAQAPGTLKYCPMCGITKPGTKDHYFPSSQFPEFSVHGLNLVPACHSCNALKDDNWQTPGLTRMFLHAFSDVIPTAPFIVVDLTEDLDLTVPAANFSLADVSPPNLTAVEWDLISSHVTKLRLISRYNEEANEEISGMVSLCHAHRHDNGGTSAGFINQVLISSIAKWGANHWRNVLWSSMATHPNVENWM